MIEEDLGDFILGVETFDLVLVVRHVVGWP
jgi:hypothetical protein